MQCCYGCGREGKFTFKSKQSPHFGKMRCTEKYRACPAQALKGGLARIGKKHSTEAKLKIGASSKGRPSPFKGKTAQDDIRILSGERHPAFGKNFSEEHRRKISDSRKGKSLSKERKAQISSQMKGSSNPRFGKGHTAEQTSKWKATVKKNQSLAGQNNPNWNPDLDREGLKVYRSAVMRLSRKNADDAGMLVGKNLGREPGGWELDHIVPISVCFKEKVSIVAASSLKNLQPLFWEDNLKKSNKEYPLELLQILKGKL